MTDNWVLHNEHASASLLDLAFSPDDDNLVVGAVVAATAKELLKALKAQMEKNGGNRLMAVNIAREGERHMLKGAGHGYIYVEQPLAKAHALGTVAAFLHKAAGDPRQLPDKEPFYVVSQDDDVTGHVLRVRAAFVERLRVAIKHAVLPAWADYLYIQGVEADLIKPLLMVGTGRFYKRGLRVERDDDKWQAIISKGLRDGDIHITD